MSMGRNHIEVVKAFIAAIILPIQKELMSLKLPNLARAPDAGVLFLFHFLRHCRGASEAKR